MRIDAGGYELGAESLLGSHSGLPTLVFLHGLAGTGKDWAPVASGLSEFDRFLVDLPAHGASGSPIDGQPITFEVTRRALLAVARSIGGPVVWVGYSYGARIALDFALHHPSHVAGLVLVSAHSGFATPKERTQREEIDSRLVNFLEAQGVGAFLKEWHALPAFESRRNQAGWEEEVTRKLRTNTANGLLRCLVGSGAAKQPPLPPEWEPPFAVLLVAGGLDAPYVAHARDLSRIIRKARLEVVPECGHAPHRERANATCRVISEFLSSSVRPAPGGAVPAPNS